MGVKDLCFSDWDEVSCIFPIPQDSTTPTERGSEASWEGDWDWGFEDKKLLEERDYKELCDWGAMKYALNEWKERKTINHKYKEMESIEILDFNV